MPDGRSGGAVLPREDVASRLAPMLARVFGAELPVTIRAWDGSSIGPGTRPAFVIRDRRALRRLLWQPGELGLARAYVAGELDIEGDVVEALTLVARLLRPGPGQRIALSSDQKREIIRTAVLLGAVGAEPPAPVEEHHLARDLSAVFMERILGPTLLSSTASWTGAKTLDDAQIAKCDQVARLLRLRPGDSLLDLGCGFGTLGIHCARRYGVRVVGVTLSEEQAAFAREQARGLDVEIRVRDFSDVDDGPFDAISALRVAEQIGRARGTEYAAAVQRLLKPGGRLLNQQLLGRPGRPPDEPTFVSSYVYPDGELLSLGRLISLLEEAGMVVHEVSSLTGDHARTLRSWLDNIGRARDGSGWERVWMLYLAGSAVAIEAGRVAVHQVLAVRGA